MTRDKQKQSSVTVTEVGEFLRNPPAGFSAVEVLGSGYRVQSDPEQSLVLIDDFSSCTAGRVVFQNSAGRAIKMRNLWEYTSMRKSLLSRRIYLLCACEAASKDRPPQQYIVSIDCSNPFMKWQLERGLDRTISSVVGESYRVDIDLSEILESWAAANIRITTKDLTKGQLVWRNASFTLKYYSDALFDFPHWFGLSKRTFRLRPT